MSYWKNGLYYRTVGGLLHRFYRKELSKSQWLSPQSIEQMQKKKLQQLLTYAHNNVPYYRKIMNDLKIASQHDPQKQLESFPILTKKVIRDNFVGIQSLNGLSLRVPWTTGGSTGEPFKFFHDKHGLLHKNANAMRFFGWAGYYDINKVAFLHSLPTEFGKSGLKITNSLVKPHQTLHFSMFGSDSFSTKKYVAAVQKFQPDGMRGYASYLHKFASEFEGKLNLSFVISGSEVLFSHERRFIEEKLGCSVWDIYGSREFSLIASECSEHCGYHVASENLIVEVVDENGKNVPKGQQGRILITDLTNYAFPFIRYEIGDLGVLSVQECPCGRGLPLIKSIEGRTGDRIVLPDGKFLSLQAFAHYFKDFDVRQFQVVRTGYNSICIKILKGPSFKESHAKIITDYLVSLFPNLDITLEYTDRMLATKSGKRKIVISQIV
jgi:phenylacetate-CoA ligase